ncbi:MAG: hypothetical protein ACXW30_03535 [Micavibrio sp.]
MTEKTLSDKFRQYTENVYEGAKDIGSLDRTKRGGLALSAILLTGGLATVFTMGAFGALPAVIGAVGIASRLSQHGGRLAVEKDQVARPQQNL